MQGSGNYLSNLAKVKGSLVELMPRYVVCMCTLDISCYMDEMADSVSRTR